MPLPHLAEGGIISPAIPDLSRRSVEGGAFPYRRSADAHVRCDANNIL